MAINSRLDWTVQTLSPTHNPQSKSFIFIYHLFFKLLLLLDILLSSLHESQVLIIAVPGCEATTMQREQNYV